VCVSDGLFDPRRVFGFLLIASRGYYPNATPLSSELD
jgi:hypothetical protein